MTARKASQECRHIRGVALLECERGQLQSGGPSFGACLECGHDIGSQGDAMDMLEEIGRLVGREAQIGGAYLGELAANAQAS
jgi:hypothetical protein